MISQFDSLGSGKPLWITKIGPNGISSKLSSVTTAVKHHGKYSKRILKFEQSIYSLCPPKHLVRSVYILYLLDGKS